MKLSHRSVSLLAAAWVVLPATVKADPVLTVVGYELASQRRVSSTLFEYSYRVSVHNSGSDATAVRVMISGSPGGVIVVQGGTKLENVPAGQSRPAELLVTVRHDRTKPFKFDDLQWQISSRDPYFTGRLSGPDGALASDAFVDYDIGPGATTPAASVSEGVEVDLAMIKVSLRQDAKVADVNALLASLGGSIARMAKRQSKLTIRLPAATSVSDLQDRLKTLMGMPGVSNAEPVATSREFSLPNNVGFEEPTGASFTSPAGGASQYIAPQLAVRAAAAWNLKGLLDDPNVANRRPSIFIADRFGSAGTAGLSEQADHSWRFEPDSLLGVRLGSVVDFLGAKADANGRHGYGVMGTIAATYEPFRDEANRPIPAKARADSLTTGLFPSPLRIRIFNASDYSKADSYPLVPLVARIAEEVSSFDETRRPRNVIVNTSWGDCGDGGVCNAFSRATAINDAIQYASLVSTNAVLSSAPGVPKFLHFYSTGNTPDRWAFEDVFGAADSSAPTKPFPTDYFSQFHGFGNNLTPAILKPSARNTFMTLQVPTDYVTSDEIPRPTTRKLDNMIGVESVLATQTEIFSFPSGPRLLPPLAFCHAPYSTRFGTLAGIGSTLNASHEFVADSMILVDGPGKEASTWKASGTSFAAPQAAAAAAWIWALAPDLAPAEVKALLVDTASPQQCDETSGAGYARTIDLYAAALSTDNPKRILNLGNSPVAPARKWLLDVATTGPGGQLIAYGDHPEQLPDGKFTQADLLQFLIEFDKRQAAVALGGAEWKPDYSRYDLNGNGVTGERATRQDVVNLSRFDLDGNMSWTQASKSVEGIPLTFTETITTDLELLVFYAYSPLYEGNAYERMMLLLPYFHHLPSGSTLFATSVSGSASTLTLPLTTFRLSGLQQPALDFVSRCGAERGTPLLSEQINALAAVKSSRKQAYFYRPATQAAGLAEQAPNATPCSSFMAAIPGTGLVWVNSAARRADPANDIEYQTRIFFGEPDLAAAPSSVLGPTPRRLATQRIDYGTVIGPGAPFNGSFSGSLFNVGALGFLGCTSLPCTPGDPQVHVPSPNLRTLHSTSNR